MTNSRRGRPVAFNAKFIKAFKGIVRKHGLLKGREFIVKNGVTVDGYEYEINISMPTLSKYAKSNVGGDPVALRRGRPLGSRKIA